MLATCDFAPVSAVYGISRAYPIRSNRSIDLAPCIYFAQLYLPYLPTDNVQHIAAVVSRVIATIAPTMFKKRTRTAHSRVKDDPTTETSTTTTAGSTYEATTEQAEPGQDEEQTSAT